MKALVYEGKENLRYRDFDDPAPNKNNADILVKIEAVSICGSDMHAYLGHDERRPAPIILGHEAAGIIQEGPHKDMRVAINPLVSCAKCESCKAGYTNLCKQREIISMPPRQGAFCEYVRMPLENLIEVPEHVSLEKATLCEPIACGWHAVKLAKKALNKPIEECHCLILGGGAIGLGAMVSLQYYRTKNITIFEPNPIRASFIESYDDIILTGDVNSCDTMYDLVIDAYGGGKSRETACAKVEPGGVIVHTGLADNQAGFDARRATLQEITFIGTYTYSAKDYKETAAHIFEGNFGNLLWSDIRHLSEGAQAFKDLKDGKISVPKITLTTQ